MTDVAHMPDSQHGSEEADIAILPKWGLIPEEFLHLYQNFDPSAVLPFIHAADRYIQMLEEQAIEGDEPKGTDDGQDHEKPKQQDSLTLLLPDHSFTLTRREEGETVVHSIINKSPTVRRVGKRVIRLGLATSILQRGDEFAAEKHEFRPHIIGDDVHKAPLPLEKDDFVRIAHVGKLLSDIVAPQVTKPGLIVVETAVLG